MPIQITAAAMKIALRMKDFERDLIMGVEVISRRLGKGTIHAEEATNEAGTLVFRDIELIMKGEKMYYSETKEETEYCAPERLTEKELPAGDTDQHPDIDGAYIISNPQIKKGVPKAT